MARSKCLMTKAISDRSPRLWNSLCPGSTHPDARDSSGVLKHDRCLHTRLRSLYTSRFPHSPTPSIEFSLPEPKPTPFICYPSLHLSVYHVSRFAHLPALHPFLVSLHPPFSPLPSLQYSATNNDYPLHSTLKSARTA
jgi:hypothetical protein